MKEQTFEESLKRVEEVVKALEGGNLALEESLMRYEAGLSSLRSCFEMLERAEKRITMIAKDASGGFVEKPFEVERSEEVERKKSRGRAKTADEDEALPF